VFCRNCNNEFPDKTQTRKKSKLGTQREEVEPAVTSIQTDQSKSVEIRHEPQLKGRGLAVVTGMSIQVGPNAIWSTLPLPLPLPFQPVH
jgi:hypothetical protein